MLLFFIVLNVVSIVFTINYFSISIFGVTGLSGLTGTLSLIIAGGGGTITIASPQNITYNFSIGDNYTIDLNFSSDFTIDTTWYTLEDLRHDATIIENEIFSGNITIQVERWENKLTLYGNDSSDDVASDVVEFFVLVPNSAPIIEGLDTELFVCEGDFISFFFNASDVDEDSLDSTIDPTNPFFIFPALSVQVNITIFEIISGTLSKANAGGVNVGFKQYNSTVTISDEFNATCCIDSRSTNITIIEINNAPTITDIGVQTIWNNGDNTSFYHATLTDDIEDGDQDDGNFTFIITFTNETGDDVDLFNITTFGVLNYTANSSSTIGVFNISVCVFDQGISNPHADIQGNCSQSGGVSKTCTNFSLTITNVNRQPNITDFQPENLSLAVDGTDTLEFNITKYDGDGTIPDTYWYAGSTFIERDSGSLFDELSYSFGCGVEGAQTIIAEVTDGLLNVSNQWNITVANIPCPAAKVGGSGSGGGGGGTAKDCRERWGCDPWENCKILSISLENNEISSEEYLIAKNKCDLLNWNDDNCGYQTKSCEDFSVCETQFIKPVTLQECYYTEFPTCEDNIKNCHDGSCEIFIDCGGPCGACPTCSDDIQNQGENGVDCGGVCPSCEIETPFYKKGTLFFGLMVIIITLGTIVVVLVAYNILVSRNAMVDIISKYKGSKHLNSN